MYKDIVQSIEGTLAEQCDKQSSSEAGSTQSHPMLNFQPAATSSTRCQMTCTDPRRRVPQTGVRTTISQSADSIYHSSMYDCLEIQLLGSTQRKWVCFDVHPKHGKECSKQNYSQQGRKCADNSNIHQ